MNDLETLAKRYGATPVADGPDYEAMAKRFGGKPAPTDLSPMEGANALASGFNRTVLTGLPGLPVKVGLDVADLARSAFGVAGHKLGILSADQLPEPLDRSKYAGSPEWIAEKMNETRGGSAVISNPRPDSEAARLLHAAGGGAALVFPMARGARPGPDMAMGAGSAVMGQAVGERTDDPAWAIAASMLPQAAVTGGYEAARRSIRGGEQGRKDMEQRLQEFEAAGVDPTVGLATGRRGPQVIESILARAPGSAGLMAEKINSIQEQLQATANQARGMASPTFGPASAGEAIKRGISDYRDRQQGIYGAMQDRALSMVPPELRFPVEGTLGAAARTLADIPNAPNVSRVVNEPLAFSQRVTEAVAKDAGARPPQQVPSPILRESGEPFMTVQPGVDGGMAFDALKSLKTRIGGLAFNGNPLTADANQGALKSLYGGVKQDINNAALMADNARVQQGLQPGVYSNISRANAFYEKSQKILEQVLAPIYKAGEPASERSYYRVEGDLNNSGTNAQRVMASLPLDARREVVATAIDRLGKASPGQQNAEGSLFNGNTFLTNWQRMTPDSRQALMYGVTNGTDIGRKLDSIAKSASMMRDANRVYSNPSGTAQATNVAGAATGLASGVLGIATGNPAAGLSTASAVLGSMALANGGARLMTNPKFVTWLSQATTIPTARVGQHLRRLALNSTAEKDRDAREALDGFVSDLTNEIGQTQRGQ